VRYERVIGWSAHYAIGVFFAAALLAIWGLEWARRPTLAPALIISFLTLVATFFVMQPAMGAGIAASKTPRPNIARLRSIATHTVYGIGLYVSAWLRALLTS
jgi:cation transport ATPase